MTLEEFSSVWLWRVPICAFLVVGAWETLAPRATLLMPATRRWRANFGLYGILAVLNYLLNFVLATSGVLAMAYYARSLDWPLLNHAWIPFWFQWIVGYCITDFAEYWAHRWAHEIGPWWRLHRVHHSDPDCDLTTALRFHPVEYFVAQACVLPLVLVLAPPVSAIMASMLTYSVVSFLSHANARLPERLDRSLRWLFITPDTHRTHHSSEIHLQNGNYATVFSIWDRAFGTYIEPLHHIEEFGVKEIDPDRAIHLPSMLLDPFQPENTPINSKNIIEIEKQIMPS